VAVTEVVVAQYGIVEEALEDDVLVAGGAGIVDAPEAGGLARCRGRVGRDVCRVVPDGIRRLEQLFMFPLAVWTRRGQRGVPLPAAGYVLENVPVPSFFNLSSSKVGSQTRSSHIWQ
jgi:hypothetical protein